MNIDNNPNFVDEVIELQSGFNVRVYGIMPDRPLLASGRFKAGTRILYCEEIIQNKHLRKFPGGGVEFAEAPGEALIREFAEETGLEIELQRLLYASPNFHRSIFRPQQLIGLYWLVKPRDFKKLSDISSYVGPNSIKLKWQTLSQLRSQQFTHSLDKEIVAFLRSRSGGLKA